MPFPVWTAGKRITAADLTAMQWHTVRQGSDQTVNNTAVLVASAVEIPVVANALYRYQAFINYRSGTTADFKYNWTLPSGASMQRFIAGAGTSATGGPSNFTTTLWRRLTESTDAPIGGAGNTNNTMILETGEIDTGANAGDVTLVFAQNTADASDTILGAVTWVDYLRIG